MCGIPSFFSSFSNTIRAKILIVPLTRWTGKSRRTRRTFKQNFLSRIIRCYSRFNVWRVLFGEIAHHFWNIRNLLHMASWADDETAKVSRCTFPLMATFRTSPPHLLSRPCANHWWWDRIVPNLIPIGKQFGTIHDVSVRFLWNYFRVRWNNCSSSNSPRQRGRRDPSS